MGHATLIVESADGIATIFFDKRPPRFTGR